MKKKLSIVDLAKQLNISPTTISFILNGKAKEKRISDELVKRVLKQIEEVGYKPNSLAQSLRTGKTMIIGLMVEDIADPFFSSIARLIEEKAYKNGYKIIYCSTDNDSVKTKDLLSMFQDRHVDGYIISPPEGVEKEVNDLIDNGTPVILFDRYLPDTNADYVVVDNRTSTYEAVLHLINNGYKNIAFITLDSLQTQMQDRLQGYESALTQHNLPHHLKEISFNQDEEQIIRHIVSFLERKPNLDAVFFGTNYLCISGLKALKKLGKKIPEDLAVVCFDDDVVFELHSPSITAIAQPIEEMSEKLITILLGKLNKASKVKKIQTDILSPELIIRASSRRL
ncbi:LacI family DNA-binding transcriptional regulator [Pedobacter xixiisoli]|uniref:Transcriptional regulator, LacI family n=1 Tax=Pedobacter xixiisoli TaxID=1476464 RepID=A0A286A0F7_9SPHI|nr:substrate-binding domain-containing protein [Pedobacter xixiisoli]SOD15351.1 transcriptional regulator, LacI family [Pedobacter xixiisoli]